MKTTFIVFFAMIMSSCLPKTMFVTQYDAPDFATVKVLCNFTTLQSYIEIDGSPTAEINLQKETVVKVSPGSHVFTAQVPNSQSPSKRLELKTGETKYLIVKFTPFIGTLWIEEATKQDFNEIISKNTK